MKTKQQMDPKQSDNISVNPVQAPAVQAADHATPLPEHKDHKEGSSMGSKLVFILITVVVLIVLGVLGYYLLAQQKSNEASQTEEITVVEEVVPTATPTPKDEVEEANQIDVTYPDSEINSVKTDLQAL